MSEAKKCLHTTCEDPITFCDKTTSYKYVVENGKKVRKYNLFFCTEHLAFRLKRMCMKCMMKKIECICHK